MAIPVLTAGLTLLLAFSPETWTSIMVGAALTFAIAYVIYKLQQRETSLHKQDHDAKLERIEKLHAQDSEKIRVLYELIIKTQKGSLGEVETTLLEQQIEQAADKISETDSEQAQALKAIAGKDKGKADDLLDRITRREHDLAEVYQLRALNEYRHGNYNEAIKWNRKILELEPDNFDALAELIQCLNKTARKEEARELATSKLKELESQNPPDNARAFTLLFRIIDSYDTYSEAGLVEPYILQAREVAVKTFGEESHQMAMVYKELGNLYHSRVQYPKSEEYFLKALQCKDLSTDKAQSNRTSTLNALGILYNTLGRYPEALAAFTEGYERTAAVLGREHPTLIYFLLGMGTIQCYTGKLDEAERSFIEARRLARERMGTQHTLYQSSTFNLSSVRINQGRYDEGEALIRELIEAHASSGKPDDIYLARQLDSLGRILSIQQKYEEAEEVVRKSLAIWEKFSNPDDPSYLGCLGNLALIHKRQGKYREAETLYLRVLETLDRHGIETVLLGGTLIHLADTYELQEQYDKAEPLYARAVRLAETKYPDSNSHAKYMEYYATILEKLGRKEEASTWQARSDKLKARMEAK